MKVLIFGGSRNIGYYAAQRLLAGGATVTFLLRNKATFDDDESIEPYVQSGKARLVDGDALKEEDVRRAWAVAAEGDDKPVDTVVFSVGATTSMGEFSLTRGVVITPANLCTTAMLNLISTMPREDGIPLPRLIVVSSTGTTKESFSGLPMVYKPLYTMIRGPLTDKYGMERVVAQATGRAWTDKEPEAEILPQGWEARVVDPGSLGESALIVQPALLTNGKCKGDKATGKPPYRAEDHDLCGAFAISRRDVAHFIVEDALQHWDTWRGKTVRLAY